MRREWWINTRAYRFSFFASVALGSLFTLLIGYFLYHTVFAQRVTDEFVALAGTDDYMSYLTLGILVYMFAVRMLYPVRDFLAEVWEGTLHVLAIIGMPRMRYHLGCMLFSTVYAALEVAVLALVAWLWLGVEFGSVNAAGVAFAVAGTFVGLYGFSLLLAAIILAVGDRMVVEGAAFSAMAFLSGVSFPTGYLPGVFQALAQIVPLTHALEALRAAALTGAGPATIAPSVVACAGLGLVYTLVGKITIDWAVRRVVEQTA
jgi:ABC-2 type transport system permease protein